MESSSGDSEHNSASCDGVRLLLALGELWFTRKQSRESFEDDLTREYREIVEKIPVKAFFDEELSDQEMESAKSSFYRYIDLSNQQVFLYQKKRISKETWNEWQDGIKANLRLKPFRRPGLKLAPSPVTALRS